MSHLERPDFIVPHDGSQPDIDPALYGTIAGQFSDLSEQLRSRWNNADVCFMGATIGYDIHAVRQDVTVVRPVDDTTAWVASTHSLSSRRLSTGSNNELASEHKNAEIMLHRDIHDVQRDTYRYQLRDDGVVRRLDAGDAYTRSIEQRLMDDFMPVGQLVKRSDPPWVKNQKMHEFVELAHRLQVQRERSVAGLVLATMLGMNNQPVGPNELAGLTTLLTGPSVRATKRAVVR